MNLRLTYMLIGSLGLRYTNCVTDQTNEDSKRKSMFYWFKDMIPDDYVQNHPPTFKGKPVKVEIRFDINNMNVIDVQNQLFEVDFYLNVEWKDYRINVPDHVGTNYLIIDRAEANRIWVPELTYRNCKECDVIEFNPTKHKLGLYGTKKIISFYIRHVGQFHCGFNLRYYPFDTQICDIVLESYLHSNDTLTLVRTPDTFFNEKTILSEFEVSRNASADVCPTIITEDGRAYTCIMVVFLFHRLSGYHIIQTYIPSILIVMISWISFWMDADALPARTTLGLTSQLTLVTQFAQAQKSLPSVSYVKALDVWMLACICMVFMTLVELALANHFWKLANKTVKASRKISSEFITVRPFEVSRPKIKDKVPVACNRMDKSARIIFPLFFLIFNISYWTYVMEYKN